MAYGEVHRFFLRSIASRGVVSLKESEQILNRYSGGNHFLSVKDMINDINKEIKPYQQAIKMTKDELTNEDVIVFLSLGYDDATKSQNIFSANELEFFRLLLEQIMTTETRQITGIHAINLVGDMKSSFTKTDAEKLLKLWCKMRYLDKDENNYALGVRGIYEFEGYLHQNMPDTIIECCLCKQIVFRGVNCPACGLAVHTRCLNRYLEKIKKWPCCRVDFNQEQIDQMNQPDGSRFVQTSSESQQHVVPQQGEVPQIDHPQQIASTQQFDVGDMEITSQECVPLSEIIPEISQRITRKRRRDQS